MIFDHLQLPLIVPSNLPYHILKPRSHTLNHMRGIANFKPTIWFSSHVTRWKGSNIGGGGGVKERKELSFLTHSFVNLQWSTKRYGSGVRAGALTDCVDEDEGRRRRRHNVPLCVSFERVFEYNCQIFAIVHKHLKTMEEEET